MTQQVLVTGATGFIAMQTILGLLDGDYRVRGTVRSLDKADALREALREHTPLADMLELVEADLNSDKGWDIAVQGCDVVLHIASPFLATSPKDHDELIRPARDGALRVLRAAKAEGVRRVVMTSSFAAIGYGQGKNTPDVLNEENWSNPDNLKDNTAYTRSKTIAEKAAWDFVNSPEGSGLELVTINPVAVLGPALCADVSTSLELIIQVMGGKLPALPKLAFGIVDVRDVAEAHIRSIDNAEAAGKRILVGDRTLWLEDIADVLRNAYPNRKIPSGTLPNWVVRLISLVNPILKDVVPRLGKSTEFSNARMQNILGITPIPAEESIRTSAESLLKYGLL